MQLLFTVKYIQLYTKFTLQLAGQCHRYILVNHIIVQQVHKQVLNIHCPQICQPSADITTVHSWTFG